MSHLKPQANDSVTEPRHEAKPSSAGDAPVITGTEIGGANSVPLNKYRVDAEIAIGSSIAETIWVWIEELRMRLKIKKYLGRKATQADLTSIDTWMKVDEVEGQPRPSKPGKID